MKTGIFRSYFLFFTLALITSAEYVSEDEPPCRENCFSLDQSEKNECFKSYMEFYSYKLVKSLFNFAKSCVFAGLWNTRYDDPDPKLFETIFMRTLNKYNNPEILGNIDFNDLNETVQYLYETLKVFTYKADKNNAIKYESYPSLKCPVTCDYELLTWQTLFYVSLTIFVLALITILLYSVFLRKQYVSLKKRAENSKFSKAPQS